MKAKFRTLACGRRWGKTDACAAEIAGRLLHGEVGKTLVVGPTLDQARLVFDRVVEFIEKVLPKREEREELGYSLRLSPHPKLVLNGAEVAVRSAYRPQSLRGHEADHIVVDEAAFVKETAIRDVLIPMTATNPDATVTLVSTPNGRGFFRDLFERGEDEGTSLALITAQDSAGEEALGGGGVVCAEPPSPAPSPSASRKGKGFEVSASRRRFWSRRAPSSDNPRVAAEFLELQREMMPEAAYLREYEAEFTDAEGQVFPGPALDGCEELSGVPEGPITIGVDWGRTIDATAVVVVRGTAARSEVIEVAQWHGLPFLEQSRALAAVLKRYQGARVWLDETGLGRAPTEFVKEAGSPLRIPGVRMKGVAFNKTSKRRMVHALSVQLEDRRLRLSGGRELMEQLAAYTHSTSPSGHVQYGARSGHDDLVCALMLAAAHLPAATRRPLPIAIERRLAGFHLS